MLLPLALEDVAGLLLNAVEKLMVHEGWHCLAENCHGICCILASQRCMNGLSNRLNVRDLSHFDFVIVCTGAQIGVRICNLGSSCSYR